MSEQTLRERLQSAVTQQPPMRSGAAEDVRRGRARLRTRRLTAASGTTLAVAGVVLAAVLVRPTAAPVGAAATAPSRGGPSIVERCTKVDNGALDPRTFGTGSRVLVSQTSPSGDVAAVLVSADRSTWASCLLFHERGAEFNGAASAYPMKVGKEQAGSQEINASGYGRGHFWYVDRFPAAVAQVRVRLDAHHLVHARAVDGFVAVAVDGGWLDMSADVQTAVTLEAADGSVLSSPAMTRGDAAVLPAYRSLVPATPLPHGGAGR